MTDHEGLVADSPLGYAALIARFSVPDTGLRHASYLRAAGAMVDSRRHRIAVNTLGPAHLGPIVRRTARIAEQILEAPALELRAREFMGSFPSATLWRATTWLYDKETRSSYAIERETPHTQRHFTIG